jgi:hypothetical protein
MTPCPRLLHPAFLFALGLASPATAQKKPVTQPLVAEAIAGQTVVILPANMVVVEPTVAAGTLISDRTVLLRWADSLIAETFAARAPEVKWILPADLRRMYRRSGGILPDPDRMGQSILRTWGIEKVPDPLRGNLRRLVAFANESRYIFVPASLVFSADSSGVLRVELSAALADGRSGQVKWRSVATGRDGTPDQVLGKALATIFPVDDNGQ